ncbi:hypothetical protein GCM10011374_34730 [Kocuria dechangensis]|uniref:VCBS repeat-containing protein n=1 Tax=Kocuria dechangensis TaxID=1176249 RepID=A0A917H4W2_9MICC|nr:hypothetical protein GCM10011374_34730 [Kocuria dechangensis]
MKTTWLARVHAGISVVALTITGVALGGPAQAAPDPDPSVISTAGSSFLPAFGRLAGGWQVNLHPRMLGDLNGDRRQDIVGFADDGVWVAYGRANGTVSAPERETTGFGRLSNGWQVDLHPRMLGDVNGDGRDDVVGFADDGVWVSYGQRNNSLSAPARKTTGFGRLSNGWQVSLHPRMLADVNGDGRDDVVGFADDGVWASLGRANNTLGAPSRLLNDFGRLAGGWQVQHHPRLLGDINGDGRDDVVGFADDGVHINTF